MINENSILAVNRSVFDTIFCRPLYDTYGFARIPETIKALFKGHINQGLPFDTLVDVRKQYQRVILLFIDGFGWRFLQEHMERFPFLRRFMEKGIVSKITSQFPSTTVAHVTCLHTGLSVGQSGLYEWYHYEPLVDAVICPLRFTYAKNDVLLAIKPSQIFSFDTIYTELQQAGIKSHIFYHHSYAFSSYSLATGQDAHIHAYETLVDALDQLNAVIKKDEKGYFYLYFPEIDTLSHRHGPDSPQVNEMIEIYLHTLEEFFAHHFVINDPDTALIVVADHGQTSTDPAKTFYINVELPEILPYLATNQKGELLVPAGSPRDFFLHVLPEYLELTFSILVKKLEGIARVYYTQTLIDEGLFGPLPLSEVFLRRVGNITILPLEGQTVYWYEEGSIKNHFQGNHGGLSRDEMETIFLFYEGSKD